MTIPMILVMGKGGFSRAVSGRNRMDNSLRLRTDTKVAFTGLNMLMRNASCAVSGLPTNLRTAMALSDSIATVVAVDKGTLDRRTSSDRGSISVALGASILGIRGKAPATRGVGFKMLFGSPCASCYLFGPHFTPCTRVSGIGFTRVREGASFSKRRCGSFQTSCMTKLRGNGACGLRIAIRG